MEIKKIKEYYETGNAEGFFLYHKKPHNSGEKICLNGLKQGCQGLEECSCLYIEKGSFCTQTGMPVKVVIEEEKHKKLVEKKAFGAFRTLEEAIKALL